VERPSYEQLLVDVGSMSFVAIGRKYGVTDKAVRKWIRWYEYQRELAEWKEEKERTKRPAA
jgi:transposase-like protein